MDAIPGVAKAAPAQYTQDQIAQATAQSTWGDVKAGADLSKPLPVFAQYEAKFKSLAATIMNVDGKASDDEQLQAYDQFREMGVNGQLFGMGSDSENAKLIPKLSLESKIGQKVQQLQQDLAKAVSASMSEDAGPLKASLSYYDSLGAFDQKVLFATGINPPLTAGRKFTGVSDWREQTTAGVLLTDYLKDAKAKGATTDPSQASDPKLKRALEIFNSRATGRTWTDMVLQLFDQDKRIDKVDLSPAAQLLLGEKPGQTGLAQARYAPGSILQTQA